MLPRVSNSAARDQTKFCYLLLLLFAELLQNRIDRIVWLLLFLCAVLSRLLLRVAASQQSAHNTANSLLA
jgi:hypothetical protein